MAAARSRLLEAPPGPRAHPRAVALAFAVALPMAVAAASAAATERLPGTSLLLTAQPARTLEVTASDPATTLGRGPGSPDDPTLVGGTLHIRSFTGERGLDYATQVRGVSYTAWVRRWIPASWGATLGGPYSYSAWLGIDGHAPAAPLDDINGPGGT